MRTWVARLAALSPFVLTIALNLLSADYLGPIVSAPPAIVGIPLGIALQAVTLAWAVIGTAIVWRNPGQLWTFVALLLFTFPALALILLASALVVIIQNLQV